MVKFIKSSPDLSQCPADPLPEVAFVGRSNAGKSSLLNAMYGKGLAKVSSRPGHTRYLNFFQVDGKYSLVDLPGYGYAERAANEAKSWKQMIEAYLRGREQLIALILVIDARRNWQEEEQGLLEWLHTHRQIPVYLALSKRDKLNQKELSARKRHFSELSGVAGLFYLSSTKGQGVKELKLAIEKMI